VRFDRPANSLTSLIFVRLLFFLFGIAYEFGSVRLRFNDLSSILWQCQVGRSIPSEK
jgi:hypothetical protein